MWVRDSKQPWKGDGGAKGPQAAHQVLQDSGCDVELEGARLTHVHCVAKVVDGEVHREQLLVDLPSGGSWGCGSKGVTIDIETAVVQGVAAQLGDTMGFTT